jgi:RecA/RadA recombinase
MAGPASCGRTSLALHLLAQTTRAGEMAAVVDAADAFDPASAEAAGVRLERVLWVRPPLPREALRSTERLLEAHGFALILLDLQARRARSEPQASEVEAQAPAPPSLPHPSSVWLRLTRAAASTGTALVVLSTLRTLGASAELALQLKPTHAHFTGTPTLFEGLDIEVALVRHPNAPTDRSAHLRLIIPGG